MYDGDEDEEDTKRIKQTKERGGRRGMMMTGDAAMASLYPTKYMTV